MPKIPSYRHLDKVLHKLGFVIIRVKGSHVQYSNGNLLITVPKYSNKEISLGVLNVILKELNISRDEFWDIYKK